MRVFDATSSSWLTAAEWRAFAARVKAAPRVIRSDNVAPFASVKSVSAHMLVSIIGGCGGGIVAAGGTALQRQPGLLVHVADGDDLGVNAILRLLRDEYGIDFSHYKAGTVTRRPVSVTFTPEARAATSTRRKPSETVSNGLVKSALPRVR